MDWTGVAALRRIALATACVFALAVSSSLASSPSAWLSWSAAGVQSDLASPGPLNNLYIRIDGMEAFRGGELDITWDPIGDGEAASLT